MCRWNVKICACGFAWTLNPPAWPCNDHRAGRECSQARQHAASLYEGSVGFGAYEIPGTSQCPHVESTRIDLKVAGYRLAVFTMRKDVNYYRSRRTQLLEQYNALAGAKFDPQNPHHAHAASIVDAEGTASQRLSYLLNQHERAVDKLDQYTRRIQRINKFYAANPLAEWNKAHPKLRENIRHTLRTKFTDVAPLSGPIQASFLALESTIENMTRAPSVAASIHSANSGSPSRSVDTNTSRPLHSDWQEFAHQLDPNLLPPITSTSVAPITSTEVAVHEPRPLVPESRPFVPHLPPPTTTTEVAVYRTPQPLFVPYYPPAPPAPPVRTYGNTGNAFLDADFDDLEDEMREMHGEPSIPRGFLGLENINDEALGVLFDDGDELPDIPSYDDFEYKDGEEAEEYKTIGW